jgi:Kdo2-lipid IVA lauroyltransferase/acyltransferase
VTRERRFFWEARAARWVGALVRPMPRRLMLMIGAALGRVLGDVDRRHLEIVRDNLRRAFPEWDETRVRRTARDVYGHFGRVLLDILWLDGRSRGEVLALVDLEGARHMETVLAHDHGCVFVTAHLGNWEMLALAHGWAFRPASLVARPLDNPALDARLVAFRVQNGNQVVYKQRALAHVLRALRERREVAFLVDQNVQAKDGIFVDFFGRKAASTTVAAALAVKTGALVVPVYSVMTPEGRHRLVYDAPLAWTPSGDREADIAALTQRIASVIEGWVRDTPEQWMWMHRRWKTQPTPTEGA